MKCRLFIRKLPIEFVWLGKENGEMFYLEWPTPYRRDSLSQNGYG